MNSSWNHLNTAASVASAVPQAEFKAAEMEGFFA